MSKKAIIKKEESLDAEEKALKKDDRLVRFDWAAKRLLRQKSNFVILEGFLSTLLDEDIRIKALLESESNMEHEDDKYNRVDILAETGTGELIIIEVQNNHEDDYFQRMLYGVSKTIAEHISGGEHYDNVKKVYSVNIVYASTWRGEDYIYHGRIDLIGMHKKDIFKLSPNLQELYKCQNVGDLFPEYYLILADGFNNNAVSKLDEWIYFLKNSRLPEKVSAKGLPEAGKCLSFMKLNEDDRRSYRAHMDKLHHIHGVIEAKLNEGRYEGKIEGLKEGKIEIAKNLLKAGMSKEDVIKFTGLTEEDLNKISI